ncbi:MAG: hypothetical protein IJZ85_06405 [Lachnospiraceae bacterium]|nr:hypothetical protein [Lachnospiraceae bacterium]
MRNTFTIEARRFPVSIKDMRTGEVRNDIIILSKQELQAAQIVGQSSKELIWRMYNRRGFHVLDIGTPEKQTLFADLEELWVMSE